MSNNFSKIYSSEKLCGVTFGPSPEVLFSFRQKLVIEKETWETSLYKHEIQNGQIGDCKLIGNISGRTANLTGQYVVSPAGSHIALQRKEYDQISLVIFDLAVCQEVTLTSQLAGYPEEHLFRPHSFSWLDSETLMWVEYAEKRSVPSIWRLDGPEHLRWEPRTQLIRGDLRGSRHVIQVPSGITITGVRSLGEGNRVVVDYDVSDRLEFYVKKRGSAWLDTFTGQWKNFPEPCRLVFRNPARDEATICCKEFAQRIRLSDFLVLEEIKLSKHGIGKPIFFNWEDRLIWSVEKGRYGSHIAYKSICDEPNLPKVLEDTEGVIAEAVQFPSGQVAFIKAELASNDSIGLISTQSGQQPTINMISIKSNDPSFSVEHASWKHDSLPIQISGFFLIPPQKRWKNRLVFFLPGGPWGGPKERSDMFDSAAFPWRELLDQGISILVVDYRPLLKPWPGERSNFHKGLLPAAGLFSEKTDLDFPLLGLAGHSAGAIISAETLCHTASFCFGILSSGTYDQRVDVCTQSKAMIELNMQQHQCDYSSWQGIPEELSPALRAHHIETPVLLQNGSLESSVQPRLLATPLWMKGVECSCNIYRNQGHVLDSAQAIVNARRSQLDWIRNHFRKSKKDA